MIDVPLCAEVHATCIQNLVTEAWQSKHQHDKRIMYTCDDVW